MGETLLIPQDQAEQQGNKRVAPIRFTEADVLAALAGGAGRQSMEEIRKQNTPPVDADTTVELGRAVLDKFRVSHSSKVV